MIELEEYIKEVDCEKIQKLKVGRFYCKIHNHFFGFDESFCPKCFDSGDPHHMPDIRVPSIDQLIGLLGKKFGRLEAIHYECANTQWIYYTRNDNDYRGQSLRLVLIRAVKEI